MGLYSGLLQGFLRGDTRSLDCSSYAGVSKNGVPFRYLQIFHTLSYTGMGTHQKGFSFQRSHHVVFLGYWVTFGVKRGLNMGLGSRYHAQGKAQQFHECLTLESQILSRKCQILNGPNPTLNPKP